VVLLALLGGVPEKAADWFLGGDETPTLVLERSEFDMMVEATGSLKAVHTVPVTAPRVLDLWNLTIRTLLPEGTTVEKGQVVASLDAQQLLRERIERDAQYRTTARELEKKEKERESLEMEWRAELEEARINLEKARLKTARSSDVVSRLDLEAARVDLEQMETEMDLTRRKVEAARRSAQAEVEFLRSKHERVAQRLQSIDEAVAAMELKAPAAGPVLHARDWRNEKVKVGQEVWRGWKVVEIPDLTEMEVLAEVDEVDARHVRPGQVVEVELEARPNVTYGGRVREVSPLARKRRWDQPYKIFEVVVSLDRTDESVMRPGMRLSARIVTERIPDVLSVPETAVEEGDRGIRIYVEEGGDAEPREVSLGKRCGGKVVVEEGVAPGEVVYVRPPRERGRI
jgi:RND family efflux transporter MFP subunit